MRFLCFLFGVFSFIKTATAQDPHYSQFFMSPLNLNPALTGFFDGKHRATLIHRNQWSTVTVPYSSYSAGYDVTFRMSGAKSGFLSAGLVVNRDQSGDGNLTMTGIVLSGSYIKPLDYRGNNIFSAGFQAGFVQKAWNKNNLMFGSQFNGERYDATLATGEVFLGEAATYPDVSSGINFYSRLGRKVQLMAGLGVFHLNAPKQNLYTTAIRIPARINFHSSFELSINKGFAIVPIVYYNAQGGASEFIPGTSFKFYLPSSGLNKTVLRFGGFSRIGDSFYVNAGLAVSGFELGLNYDVNTSDLKVASNNSGGIEVALSYIVSLQGRPSQRLISFPRF